MLAGAARTASSLDRFEQVSQAADVELLTRPPSDEQLRRLRATPGVVSVVSITAFGIVVPRAVELQAIGVSSGASNGADIDRARIIVGRAADPNVAEEVTVGEGLARAIGVSVGDDLEVLSYTPGQVNAQLAGEGSGPPKGPQVELHVVGIDRRPLDLGERGAAGGILMLTPAFGQDYGSRIGVFGARLRLRLENGDAGARGVAEVAREIFGPALFQTQGLAIETEGARAALGVMTTALRALAIAVAVASALTLVSLLGREIRLSGTNQRALLAFGLTRRQRALVVGAFALPAALAGACLAVGLAVLLSPRFPLGVARRADPSVGFHFDGVVLLPGAVVIVGVVVAIAAVLAVRASSLHVVEAGVDASPEMSLIRRTVRRLPLSVGHGARMVLGGGTSAASVPVRSSIVATVAGSAVLTAVLVFTASVAHLSATPRLYGWTFDFAVLDRAPNRPCGGNDDGLSKLRGLASVSEICYQNVSVDGSPVVGLAITGLRGDAASPAVVEGRPPSGPSEVALGSATFARTGRKIGDSVQVKGRTAGGSFTVVGRAVFPTLGQAQPLKDGIWFTGAGFAPLFDQNVFSRYLVGRFASGADRSAVSERIRQVGSFGTPTLPRPPVEITRLQGVGWLPVSLAALLGGLALIAVTHSVVTSTRLRRRELAVLGVLGFLPRQIRSTIQWQATIVGLVGLVVGAPLGVILGRQVWLVVVRRLGVDHNWSIPLAAVLVQLPGTLALLCAVASVPAIRASRRRLAASLRSE